MELKGTDKCEHEAGQFKCLLCPPKKDADKDWHALNKPGDIANMRRHAAQVEHTHMRRIALTVLLDHTKEITTRLDSIIESDVPAQEAQEQKDQLTLEKDQLEEEIQAWDRQWGSACNKSKRAPKRSATFTATPSGLSSGKALGAF